eukprot:3002687-Pyramimonas_sp.AAC.1
MHGYPARRYTPSPHAIGSGCWRIPPLLTRLAPAADYTPSPHAIGSGCCVAPGLSTSCSRIMLASKEGRSLQT